MTGTTEILRRATVDDHSIIVELNKALAKETEDLDLPDATISRGVYAVLRDPSKGAYFVVQVGDEIVAQLMITLEWSDWRNAEVWWVQSVFVRTSYRRKGYYRRLYAYVKEEAKNAGAGGVRLYADNSNGRAHETYKAMGMTSHYKVFEDLFTDY